MALTFIDTNSLPRTLSAGGGEATEILNDALCGAKNAVGTLRWLKSDQKYLVDKCDKHQLIYLMEGNGSIVLENRSYAVAKGAGVYLGPSETATFEAAPGGSLKLFQLVVPKIAK